MQSAARLEAGAVDGQRLRRGGTRHGIRIKRSDGGRRHYLEAAVVGGEPIGIDHLHGPGARRGAHVDQRQNLRAVDEGRSEAMAGGATTWKLPLLEASPLGLTTCTVQVRAVAPTSISARICVLLTKAICPPLKVVVGPPA